MLVKQIDASTFPNPIYGTLIHREREAEEIASNWMSLCIQYIPVLFKAEPLFITNNIRNEFPLLLFMAYTACFDNNEHTCLLISSLDNIKPESLVGIQFNSALFL